MKLTYPKTHLPLALIPYLEEYAREHPNKFDEWLAAESNSKHRVDPRIPKIAEHVKSFLSDRLESDGPLALDVAFADLRRLLIKKHLGYDLDISGKFK